MPFFLSPSLFFKSPSEFFSRNDIVLKLSLQSASQKLLCLYLLHIAHCAYYFYFCAHIASCAHILLQHILHLIIMLNSVCNIAVSHINAAAMNPLMFGKKRKNRCAIAIINRFFCAIISISRCYYKSASHDTYAHMTYAFPIFSLHVAKVCLHLKNPFSLFKFKSNITRI